MKIITDKNEALIAINKYGNALLFASGRLQDNIELRQLTNN